VQITIAPESRTRMSVGRDSSESVSDKEMA
jgi:hypothetical protein